MSPIERDELRQRTRAMTEEEQIVVTHEMPDEVLIHEIERRIEALHVRNELLRSFCQQMGVI